MINVDRYELCVTFALNVPTRDVFMFFFQKRKSHTAMMNFEDISAIDNSYTFDFEEFLMQQYNLNVQREVMRNLVVTAGYIGSTGVHLGRKNSVNQRTDFTFVNGRKFFPELPAGVPPQRLSACW